MARLPIQPRPVTHLPPPVAGLEVNDYAPLALTSDIPCEAALPELDTKTNTLPVYPKREDLP